MPITMEVIPKTRRTRFVCVSDTHNTFPKLPQGDVLIHAGDLTNQGSYSELQKSIDWINSADHEVKIIVAGNHDITLDPEFYAQNNVCFHNQNVQEPAACMKIIAQSPSITYLNHECKDIRLHSRRGPQTKFRVFGSPYSPKRGLWAFGYDLENAPTLWDDIPSDVDIVVTHTPPRYHCNESPKQGAAGCEALRQALWRVRPRLAVCGHIHEGRGVESVVWDAQSPLSIPEKHDTCRWNDFTVGTKKQFRVDLTSGSQSPLQNDGTVMDKQLGSGAVSRRQGRAETCIVNAAILGTSWPHKPEKVFNKPIVVDIDLPVADQTHA